MARFSQLRPSALVLALGAAGLLLLAGCGRREDPMLRLSAGEALEEGKALLEKGKYFRATKFLTHAFEVEPNSRSGREALLLAADALYLQGGTDNFIKCEAKYRDFLNRFPTSDRSDYAQYKVAACLGARAESPTATRRSPAKPWPPTRSCCASSRPASTSARPARQMRDLTDRLATHELVVGEFYNRYGRYGICEATIRRLETVQQGYPDFRQMDAVLYHIGVAYSRCTKEEQASLAFEDLRRRFPDSPYPGEIAGFQKEWAKESLKIQKRDEELRKMLGNSKSPGGGRGGQARWPRPTRRTTPPSRIPPSRAAAAPPIPKRRPSR